MLKERSGSQARPPTRRWLISRNHENDFEKCRDFIELHHFILGKTQPNTTHMVIFIEIASFHNRG